MSNCGTTRSWPCEPASASSRCRWRLYIFCGEHLLCARQRASNQDASAGVLEEVERMVGQIRQSWPAVQITLRADSGFCREELMAWCQAQQVDYVFGPARNERLQAEIVAAMASAKDWPEDSTMAHASGGEDRVC